MKVSLSEWICLLIILAYPGLAYGQSSLYCNKHPLHTLCIHSGLGDSCGDKVEVRGMSVNTANYIVSLHNRLRSRVAYGQETKGLTGHQPQASNMRIMEWDDELATLAQTHADQCIFQHECYDCRTVPRFTVGQNLFMRMESFKNPETNWARAIDGWYAEVKDFSNQHIDPFKYNSPVGHYTQMVWADTYKIGCGFNMHFRGGWWRKLYTCNYGPAGNYVRQAMYKIGIPCSACPIRTTCSHQYLGLCSTITFDPIATGHLLSVHDPAESPVFGLKIEETVGEELTGLSVQGMEPRENVYIRFHGSEPEFNDLRPYLKKQGAKLKDFMNSTETCVPTVVKSIQRTYGRFLIFYRTGNAQTVFRKLTPLP